MTADPVSLCGQVAIVTGGGRGVGRTMSARLAQAGAGVAVVARSHDEIEAAATDINASGGRAIALPTDITNRAAVESMVAETERRLGPVDLLVNNAGSLSVIGPIWEVDPDKWWRDVDVNLRGVFLCARAVLPGMIERRRGRIINVSSGGGLVPSPYTTSYGSSKAAVINLTNSLAASTQAYGISVFAISPGLVHTTMADYLVDSPEAHRWLPENQHRPESAWISAEPAAKLVLRLASGEADALSGRFIHLNYNLDEMLAQTDAIQRNDLYTLRLNQL
jgi:NAD(P)-dependent dehydrogenase (short-subunit alcohol dehydrogenase family)